MLVRARRGHAVEHEPRVKFTTIKPLTILGYHYIGFIQQLPDTQKDLMVIPIITSIFIHDLRHRLVKPFSRPSHKIPILLNLVKTNVLIFKPPNIGEDGTGFDINDEDALVH